MFLPIPILAELETIHQCCQLCVDANLLRANLHHQLSDYEVEDQVLVVNQYRHHPQLAPTPTGPFIIQQVFANGTILILCHPHVYEHINICHLHPFHSHD
jgi:hypothetical protein